MHGYWLALYIVLKKEYSMWITIKLKGRKSK